MRLLFLPFFLVLTIQVFGQQKTLNGRVIDQQSREALPFVNIVDPAAQQLLGTSDIDGQFSLQLPSSTDSLLFIYLGYENYKISTDTLATHQTQLIALQATAISTNEVVVVAGENPAYRIIRAASARRKANNPKRLSSFRYLSYNKSIAFNKLNAPKVDTLFNQSDTAMTDSLPVIPFYYMLMESVARRIYKFPNKDQETIIANRVSGLKNPTFATLATAFQPFSFYDDLIRVLDNEFINPLSPGSIKRYEFRLEDSLLQGKDTVFVISFFPRKGKVFDALKGSLYINSDGYAVEYVLAQPVFDNLIQLNFEQKYIKIDGHWFPKQLNFELSIALNSDPSEFDALTLQGKSYLSEIEIEPKDIRARDFGLTNVIMEEEATQRDSAFWAQYRRPPLNQKEKNTYPVIDSLGAAINLDGIMNFASDAATGFINAGPVSIEFMKILNFNPFEKFRLGLGLHTSPKVSKIMRVGGYFGYGFGDKKWKYGGNFLLKIAPKKDIALQVIYRNDVSEPAAIFPRGRELTNWVTPLETFARRYFLTRMDYEEKLELAVHFRLFRSIQLRPYANVTAITPGYNYSFENGDGQTSQQFRLARTGLQLRWTYQEKYADFNGQRSVVEQRYPVFYLHYERGVQLPPWGNISYQRLLAGLEVSQRIHGLGHLQIDLQAGILDQSVPFSLLFNGRGSFSDRVSFYARRTFQTMDIQEFISDRFVYAFLSHNFGPIGISTDFSRPELQVHQSVGFGWLNQPQSHLSIPYKTMEKGYYESGLTIRNLYRTSLQEIAYLGLNLGIFYRYGPYRLRDHWFNNAAFKVGFDLSF